MYNYKGIVVLKENVARNKVFIDDEDGSVIRNENQLLEMFATSGLTLVETVLEANYPQEMVPVKTYILQ